MCPNHVTPGAVLIGWPVTALQKLASNGTLFGLTFVCATAPIDLFVPTLSPVAGSCFICEIRPRERGSERIICVERWSERPTFRNQPISHYATVTLAAPPADVRTHNFSDHLADTETAHLPSFSNEMLQLKMFRISLLNGRFHWLRAKHVEATSHFGHRTSKSQLNLSALEESCSTFWCVKNTNGEMSADYRIIRPKADKEAESSHFCQFSPWKKKSDKCSNESREDSIETCHILWLSSRWKILTSATGTAFVGRCHQGGEAFDSLLIRLLAAECCCSTFDKVKTPGNANLANDLSRSVAPQRHAARLLNLI